MDELDIILTEQLYSARSRKKLVNRLRKLMPTEHALVEIDNMIDLKIAFYEEMISDKQTKPKKRINIKKTILRSILSVKFVYLTLLFGKKKK